jgi:hypothetical protein
MSLYINWQWRWKILKVELRGYLMIFSVFVPIPYLLQKPVILFHFSEAIVTVQFLLSLNFQLHCLVCVWAESKLRLTKLYDYDRAIKNVIMS